MGVWGEGGSDMRYKVKTGQYNMKELFYLFTQGKSIFLSSIIDIGCPCLPFIFFFKCFVMAIKRDKGGDLPGVIGTMGG